MDRIDKVDAIVFDLPGNIDIAEVAGSYLIFDIQIDTFGGKAISRAGLYIAQNHLVADQLGADVTDLNRLNGFVGGNVLTGNLRQPAC